MPDQSARPASRGDPGATCREGRRRSGGVTGGRGVQGGLPQVREYHRGGRPVPVRILGKNRFLRIPRERPSPPGSFAKEHVFSRFFLRRVKAETHTTASDLPGSVGARFGLFSARHPILLYV